MEKPLAFELQYPLCSSKDSNTKLIQPLLIQGIDYFQVVGMNYGSIVTILYHNQDSIHDAP